MLEVVEKLRKNAGVAVEQARINSYEFLESLAGMHGYEFFGLTHENIAHFARAVGEDKYQSGVSHLRSSLRLKGIEVYDVNFVIGSRRFTGYMAGKTYIRGGGVPTVEDAQDITRGIATITYSGGKIILGIPFDISEQHVDALEEVAGKLDMQPSYPDIDEPITPLSDGERIKLERLWG